MASMIILRLLMIGFVFVSSEGLGNVRTPTVVWGTSILRNQNKRTLQYRQAVPSPRNYWDLIGHSMNILEPEPLTMLGPDPSKQVLQVDMVPNGSLQTSSDMYYNPCQTDSRVFLWYNIKGFLDMVSSLVIPDSSHQSELLSAEGVGLPDIDVFRFPDNTTSEPIGTTILNSCEVAMLSYRRHANITHVTESFAHDVCLLPADDTSNPVFYTLFLTKWGTSFVSELHMGRIKVERYVTTKSTVFEHLQDWAEHYNVSMADYLHVGGPYKGFSSSLIARPDQMLGLDLYGQLKSNDTIGSHDQLVPIKMTITSLVEAFNWTYWAPVLTRYQKAGICSHNVTATWLQKIASNVNKALRSYYENLKPSLPKLQDVPLQVPVVWPGGSYGLMQASSGCPGSGVTWLRGWRKQDTEDATNTNQFSSNIAAYLSGEFNKDFITTRFCLKEANASNPDELKWPKGSYCVLKYKKPCPSGLQEGYVYWDDEDLINANGNGGSLPDGTYNENTNISYCCRGDGSPHIPIVLPTDTAFILLRYGPTCQVVYGMNVTEVYVQWDDDDVTNKDASGGMHPSDTTTRRMNHRLSFCHYNRKTTATTG